MTVTQGATEALASVAEAQQRLLDLTKRIGAEDVPLEDAWGRVLAEPLRALSDLPRFDNSAMDGYAVRAAEIAGASNETPARLPVRGEVAAGETPQPLAVGAATRILTGAMVPPGADTVVRQEDTRRDGADVLVTVASPAGTHVRRRGEEVTAGAVVLESGVRLTPADVAVAAAAGVGSLSVGFRPRIAILATGDEVRPPGADLAAGEVSDAISPMLAGAARDAGADPMLCGIVPDSPDVLRHALASAAASADIVVTSAGVSVGDRDHVREVLAELGEIALWRVAMRPGKPLLVGRIGRVPFVGLPGNPVSSSVTFELFVRPALLHMQGARDPQRRRLRVRLGETMSKPPGLETFARARLVASAGDLPLAVSSGGQGSHMLSSLAAADVLLALPAEPASVPEGAVVEAISLR